MKKILLLSDTHSHIDEKILHYVDQADEVWHAGDIGNTSVLDQLAAKKPLKAVYGNIDGQEVRLQAPEFLVFTVEDVKVLMIHIGGSPGRYVPRAKTLIAEHHPNVVICGHSHILKVMQDQKRKHLHLNPGAAGISGFHKIRTMLRFTLVAGKIEQLEVIEIGLRGALSNAIDRSN